MSSRASAERSERQAWAEFEQVVRWTDRFFVIYVFAATPGQAQVLAARTVRQHPRGSVLLRTAEQGGDLSKWARELEPLLCELSAPASYHDRPILWIDGSLEFEHEEDGVWRRGWLDLLARLNSRRESLDESLRGVVLVAPPQAKAAMRLGGPDLWSIRAHAVEIERPKLDVPTPASPVRPEVDERQVEALRRAMERVRGRATVRERVEVVKLMTRLARASVSVEPLIESEAELARVVDDGAGALFREVLRVTLERGELALTLDRVDVCERALELFARASAGESADTVGVLQVRAQVVAGELALARGDGAAAEQALAVAQRDSDEAGLGASSPFADRIALGLGRAYQLMGESGRAEGAFARASATWVRARELGLLALRRGVPDLAVERLREAVALAGSLSVAEQVGLHRELAAAYMHGSHWVAARASLEAARSLAPNGSVVESACLRDIAVLREAIGNTS